MTSSGIPGADAMQDSFEFIKKMWAGMGVPGMVVPTLSVEEINKKITDLKAVEGWLDLNLTMLRTSIQALEVQSATISALQAMGVMNSVDQQSAAVKDVKPEPIATPDFNAALSNSSAWWELLQNQFTQAINSVAGAETMAKSATETTTDTPKHHVKPRAKAASSTDTNTKSLAKPSRKSSSTTSSIRSNKKTTFVSK